MEKLTSNLNYKTIVAVDCALISVSSGDLFTCYLNIIQIKIYLHLPMLPNTSIHIFVDFFRLCKSSESKYYKGTKEMYNLQCVSAKKNYALDVYNCIINQIMSSLKP